jgi:hypothetical protein
MHDQREGLGVEEIFGPVFLSLAHRLSSCELICCVDLIRRFGKPFCTNVRRILRENL